MGSAPRIVVAIALAAALPVPAGTAPSRMMANVFRFSEAGAVLEVCFASEAYKALPAEKAEVLQKLSGRMARLVKAIGQYYDDASVHPTYEATRARIASESRLLLHVKNHYGYCGDRLAADMEKYVAENEMLLGRYFSQPNEKTVQRRPPDPPPVPGK